MAGTHKRNTSGLKPFKPGQSGNPNGRPRKMVSQVIKDLGDAGIENVTKAQIRGTIETMLNCTRKDLERYAEDESNPVYIRMVARQLIKSGKDEKVFEMLLDRAFGKAGQNVKHDHAHAHAHVHMKKNDIRTVMKELSDPNKFSNEELETLSKLGMKEVAAFEDVEE